MNDEEHMTMENNIGICGYLELIAGPMYSGKTSKLLDIYKKYDFCGMSTLVITTLKTQGIHLTCCRLMKK